MWHWLHQSWAGPLPPRAIADSLPVLTTEALTAMTTFWTHFMQEADSIRTIARQSHQREILVPIGPEQLSVRMVDMPGMAAKYPSVAAGLEAAGLTARQHDAYRAALISASVATQAGNLVWTRTGVTLAGTLEGVTSTLGISAMSTLGKNVAFMWAHKDAFKALGATGMWTTP